MTIEFERVVLAESLELVRPVTAAAESAASMERLLDAVGWDLTAIAGVDISDVADAAMELKRGVDEVIPVLADGPKDLFTLAKALSDLARAVANLAQIGAGWTPAQGLPANTLQLFVEDVLWFLLELRVQLALPRTHAVLELTGLLVREQGTEITRSDGRVARRAQERPRLDLGRVGRVLTDPAGALRERWGMDGQVARDADAIADLAGPVLARALGEFGLYAHYGTPGAASDARLTPDEQQAARRLLHTALVYEGDEDGAGAARLDVALALTTVGGKLVLVVVPFGTLAVQRTLGDWELTARLQGDVGAIEVKADGVDFEGAAADPHIELSASAHRKVPEDGSPLVRLGSPTGTRGEIGGLKLAATVDLRPSGAVVSGSIELEHAYFAIAAGDGDGFLAKVLPKEPMVMDIGLALDWSPLTGLRVRGGGQLEVILAIDATFGPIRVPTLEVALRATPEETALELTASPSVTLGPIAAAIERIGIRGRLQPAAGGGALGALGLEVGFKPPSGVGLAIDASIVRGGGFVYFDAARGQYAGVLELEIAETIAVKAIGLIGTRMPDGSPGFSLFVLISAEGFAPFQLGMGFTLNGIGGLLGINRSVNVEPLRTGLKSGTLDSVLFPTDPVRNAPAIISTLNSVFPARRDHYVFGPMAIIGWGSPTLLTLKLGLLLEFPDPTRLILLGRLAVALPTPDEPIVRLQMDAIGVLDFDRGELSLDASLFDSRVAAFVITGDMALRIGWGAEPQFVLSVGGFSPRMQALSGVRPLERLAISLAESDNPRLRLEAYFAVTSNTLQFGARLELYAAAAGFSLEGHLGFDALLQFVPFGFVIDFSAGVAVRFGGQVIFSVSLEVTLSGPSPWRAVGSASFRFLLIEATVGFDLQIGEGVPQPAPELVDVRKLLAEALSDPRNWASQLPAEAPPLVSLRDGGGAGVSVHPLAVLVVRERVVPLNRRIVRYGSARVDGAQRFSLTLSDSDGDELPFDAAPVTDAWARGLYEDLRDEEKLTLPAFESMDSGLRLGLDELAFAGVCDVPEGYETWLWDPALDVNPQRLDADPALDGGLPDPRPLAGPAGLRP